MKCPKCGRRWNRDRTSLWNTARKTLEKIVKWLEDKEENR